MKATEQYKEAKKIVVAYEKRGASEFYDKEKQDNQDSSFIGMYEMFVNYLFGENELGVPLESILSLQSQLTFSQFVVLLSTAKESGTKILPLLLSIENDKKYTSGKKSLFLILNNWLTQRFVRNFNKKA